MHDPSASDLSPKKLRKRSGPWLVAAGLGVCLVLLALTAAVGKNFDSGELTLGTTSIRFNFDPNGTQDYLFGHASWDGPTGEFSSGHDLSIKLPRGVLELHLARTPLEAARKRLPKDVPGLIRALDSRDNIVVFCAAEKLGEMGAAAIPALPKIVALDEQNYLDASESILSIAQAAPAQAAPLLIPGLESTNLVTAEQFAEILGSLGTNALPAAPALQRLFERTSPARQPEVAVALWKITGGCDDTLPVLMRLLENEGDPLTAINAVSAMGVFDACAEPAVPLLVRQLESSQNIALLGYCAETLGKIGKRPDLCVPALLTRLEFEEALKVRAAIIIALGGFGTNGVPHLLELCRSANARDQFSAAHALIAAGPHAAAACDYFFEELQSPRPRSIAMACEFFGAVGESGRFAVPKLRELLTSKDSQVRAGAAATLIQQGEIDQATVQILLENLHSVAPPKKVIDLFARIAAEHPQFDQVIEKGMQKIMPEALLKRYGMLPANTREPSD